MSTQPDSQSTKSPITGAYAPLPWRHDALMVRDANGRLCAELAGMGPLAYETAEFIVRACNSHDELIAALNAIFTTARGDEKSECRTIRKFLDDRGIFNDDIGGSERLIAEACKYAIAKAEGKS